TNRIGNIHFHGMLSTAWPWPYAPEGLPELTVQMNRPDPFNPHDGCGDGTALVHPGALVDKIYNLWNRDPVTVTRAYTATGKQDPPSAPNLKSYWRGHLMTTAKDTMAAFCVVAGGLAAAVVGACSPAAPPPDAPPAASTAAAADDEVLLCDGETKVKIDASKPMTRANGQA